MDGVFDFQYVAVFHSKDTNFVSKKVQFGKIAKHNNSQCQSSVFSIHLLVSTQLTWNLN